MPIPLIAPDSSAAAGVSLTTYTHRLARTLGYFASGTVTTLAASLEAERYVISSSMRSDMLPPEHWDGLFLSVLSGDQAGEARRLINGGYEGTNGVLTVDYPFDAALEVGDTFMVAVLPMAPYQGMTGLREIVNEALELLPVIDFVSLTVTADDDGVKETQYSLAGYPWPVRSVRAVYYPRTSTTTERRREMPKCWAFEQNAESPVLAFRSLPADVGQAVEIQVVRPAHTRICQAGIWGDSLTGLVDPDDGALYDPLTVLKQARPIALRRMALLYPPDSKERMKLESQADGEEFAAAVSRFFGGFRANGAQKVRGTGGR